MPHVHNCCCLVFICQFDVLLLLVNFAFDKCLLCPNHDVVIHSFHSFLCFFDVFCKHICICVFISISVYFTCLFHFNLSLFKYWCNFSPKRKRKLKNFFFLFFKIILHSFLFYFFFVFYFVFLIPASHILHLDDTRHIAFGIIEMRCKTNKQNEIKLNWKKKLNETIAGRYDRICSCCVEKVRLKLAVR